jgi:hypothetical protein
MIFTSNQKVFYLSLKLYKDNEHKDCCKSLSICVWNIKLMKNKKKEWMKTEKNFGLELIQK